MKSGNRRLNRAFHRMALSQISRSGNDAARDYFKRKISEGKTKAQALVCLRRQLINVVWMMLKHKLACLRASCTGRKKRLTFSHSGSPSAAPLVQLAAKIEKSLKTDKMIMYLLAPPTRARK